MYILAVRISTRCIRVLRDISGVRLIRITWALRVIRV
jgi:hypothetical protein